MRGTLGGATGTMGRRLHTKKWSTHRQMPSDRRAASSNPDDFTARSPCNGWGRRRRAQNVHFKCPHSATVAPRSERIEHVPQSPERNASRTSQSSQVITPVSAAQVSGEQRKGHVAEPQSAAAWTAGPLATYFGPSGHRQSDGRFPQPTIVSVTIHQRDPL